jgi:hypothetical protein
MECCWPLAQNDFVFRYHHSKALSLRQNTGTGAGIFFANKGSAYAAVAS